LYVSGNTGLASRVVYNRLEGTANAGSSLQGCDGHGTLNGHIVGGYNDRTNGFPHQDSAGYRYGLGIAPFAKLGSSVIFDPDYYTFPDFEDMISRAYRDGARISSESWGSDTFGGYDIDAQAYDALVRDAQPTNSAVAVAGNQPMIIVFPSGNAGAQGAATVGSPGTAKNVITVGASENVHSHAITNGGISAIGLDGCGSPDTEADNASDMAVFSSRGPCSDGRLKPELVAPGTHITGGVAQQSKTMAGNGNDLLCFSTNATGICAIQNDSGGYTNYFPTNQQWYTTSSGTSHSTPAVAGGAALVWQYFLNQGWGQPSPAMVKAYLVNTARYMTGLDAGDTLWSNNQGLGMMNLGTAFDGVARVRRDQRTNDVFTASGQSHAISGVPVDTNKPVRVALSWTDAPGSTAGNAYKNDLDLTVSAGGILYRGNVFNGANSTNGGAADRINNAECVFLPAGTTGALAVVVSAANINSDGVPNVAPALDQDYALVVYNLSEVPKAVVVNAGAALVAEGCNPGNGAIDPNETVTVNLALLNAGVVNTTNVVATLLATGGVTSPSIPQTYGALLTNGPAATNSFSFKASGACGSIITATLSLNDNGLDLGTAAFEFRLGGIAQAFQSGTNGLAIAILDESSADPYPSSIVISNLTGTISKVTATLRGFGHEWPADVDIVLVSPAGQRVCLMGGKSGGTNVVVGLSLTFDDDAATGIPEPVVSGTYLPTGSATNMNSPAPGPPYASAMSAFNGANPNGAWKLYVRDAWQGQSGSLTQGWSLAVTATRPLCCGNIPEPRISAFFKTNTTAVAARLTSEAGQIYRLDYSRNLTTNPALWTPVATNTGNGSEITLMDSNIAVDVKRYYRVVSPIP
jgi:subtilisin-like proprotein convertase family protein